MEPHLVTRGFGYPTHFRKQPPGAAGTGSGTGSGSRFLALTNLPVPPEPVPEPVPVPGFWLLRTSRCRGTGSGYSVSNLPEILLGTGSAGTGSGNRFPGSGSAGSGRCYQKLIDRPRSKNVHFNTSPDRGPDRKPPHFNTPILTPHFNTSF